MSHSVKYNKGVNKAIGILKLRKELKYEVAKISFEVCFSQHGGANFSRKYNVAKFSKDIGIGYKTLCRWRREYDLVVSKIGLKPEKIKRKALEETLKLVNKGSTKKEVRDIYKNFESQQSTSTDAYLLDLLKRTGNIRFGICSKYNLKKVNQETLKEIHVNIKAISEFLDNHFSGKENPGKRNTTGKKKVEKLIQKHLQ